MVDAERSKVAKAHCSGLSVDEQPALLSDEGVEISNGDHCPAADPHTRQLAIAQDPPENPGADTERSGGRGDTGQIAVRQAFQT